jgi:hypothetical protein
MLGRETIDRTLCAAEPVVAVTITTQRYLLPIDIKAVFCPNSFG